MAIADVFEGALNGVKELFGEVGNGRENREEDVKQVKRGLGALGYWEEPKHGITGFIDRELDQGIKDLQADHGLRVDGWLRPRGETESALQTRLAKAETLPYPDIRVRPGKSWEQRGWGGPRGSFGLPTLRDEKERIDSILGDRPARFNIEDDPEADPGPEIWEFAPLGRLAVSRHDGEIERAAKKRGIDADLIRSIMWAENARGHRFGGDRLADVLGVSETKLPMNIKPHWGRLIGVGPEDMTRPEVNIEAAAELIRRIRDRTEQPTAAKIGSIWQYGGQEKVTDMGAAVARLYAEKPWTRVPGSVSQEVPY